LDDRFNVQKYSKDNLKTIFEETSTIGFNPDNKNHLDYLFRYIDHLNCHTIVVEEEYIDRDYLEDFATYYVRCFNDYKRKCRRLHFFSCEFEDKHFRSVLYGENQTLSEKLKDEYLGFIVLKRLPQTIIGRTCLKHYTEESGRFFTITDNQKANLFGLKLSVQSLPFQEQDSVVAACATSSLWSAFHKTSRSFQHSIPSPSAITKQASELISYGINDKREFPNHGLTIEQMAYAVKKNSMEPLIISFADYKDSSEPPIFRDKATFVLKSCIYGYLSEKIPIILLLKLYDNVNRESRGLHAVTITGFKMGELSSCDPTQIETVLQSSYIDKIYVHDDQIGPFARMEFSEEIILYKNGDKHLGPVLTTTWKDKQGHKGNVYGLPIAILIPIYHKIRIPLPFICDEKVIDFIKFVCFITKYYPFTEKWLWKIKLETVNSYKTRIHENKNLKEEKRIEILTKPLPHYIWVISSFLGDKPVMEMVFDATDLEQANSLILVNEYYKGIISTIKLTLDHPDRIIGYYKNEVFDYFRK
jgi:hypothetical protein